MKVYIGPYQHHTICNIHEKYMNKKYGGDNYDSKTSLDKFVERIDDILQWVYDNSINLILKLISRKIKVRIDPYDTYSVDDTLAHIIMPLLIKFRDNVHGGPMVNDEDVPEPLKCSTEDPVHCPNYFARWDYVLDEMIWAFANKIEDGISSKEDYDRMQNGFRLFGKYYNALWD